MALLFKKSADNDEFWRRELGRRLPDLEFRVWPDHGDPREIEFALMFRPEPGSLGRFPNLKAILATGAGVDGIFSDPSRPAHVPIARIVDPWMTTRMAQWVVHAVIRLARGFARYDALQRRAEWRECEEWSETPDSVGILGCGEIGGECGRVLASLGYDVAGWTRTPRELGPIRSFAGEEALAPFLARSRYLVCLLPLTPATCGIVNARTLALLPRGAAVINAARGAQIVTGDLLAALDSGQLDAAYLDVTEPEPLPPDHPLWRHPKVTITPHIAGITNPITAAAQVAENVRRVRAGEPLLNRVDPVSGY